ncbi:hypothetical protein SCHPADRAFT_948091 [Schizopora paradoxa]|uniref:Uncharacterized protein n=1 Tax=Schizopora paradoxa TaxID=27342 RepID=A0A0H2QWQ6_9AGAM|nr:hypothetical protein SCHPADRAFT_948091 [Schizopora paradoxa]
MARTDGENIERGWAWMNPASLSTREMGPGARHDTLDDQWMSWNYALVSRLGDTLFNRFDEAYLQAQLHRKSHDKFSATFSIALVAKWAQIVDEWSADPMNKDLVDPFQEPPPDITMADVRRDLIAEEERDVREGQVPVHSTSASQFLVHGLNLEDQQRALKLKSGGKSNRTTRSVAADDKESELRRKIVMWRKQLQTVYMPGLKSAETNSGEGGGEGDDESDSGADVDDIEVWDMDLRLPSSLPALERNDACVPGLVEKERRLRLAQLDDALEELKRGLRTIRNLKLHRTAHTAGAGVAANTRMQSLIAKHDMKVKRTADRYRATRLALLSLDSSKNWQERLQVLSPGDVSPPAPVQGESEGRFKQSWIWSSGGAGQVVDGIEDDEAVDESLRFEWARSLARAERWEEEVVLLQVEMCRVLRRLLWSARDWRLRVAESSAPSTRALHGYHAYAAKQADVLEDRARRFSSLWLSLLKEHNLPTPSGWPAPCLVQYPSSSRIKRRRHRMKLYDRVAALAFEDLNSNQPSATT